MRRDPFRQQSRSILKQPLPWEPAGPGPYDPHSPDYAERHKVTETVMPNGMVRIDVGEPLS